MKLYMLPSFAIDEIANVASGNAIACGKFTLENVSGCIFGPDGSNYVGCQPALPVSAAAIVEGVLQQMIPGVPAERSQFEVFKSVVSADAVLVMNGEIAWRVKKGNRDHSMRKMRSVFAALTKNARWISNTSWPLAQNATMQSAAINASSVKASDAPKIGGFIKALISWNRLPYFCSVLSHSWFSLGY
jgi:hypothetical protein